MKSEISFVPPCCQEAECARRIDERIGCHTAFSGDYQKSINRVFALRTGVSVLTNEVPFLVILDFDINKKLDLVQKEAIYDRLFRTFKGRGSRIVKTCHGGLHVYCNQGDFELAENREVKVYRCADYDMDMFGCVNPAKKSTVLLPGSQIRDRPDSPILEYKIMDDPPDGVIALTVAIALEMVGISLEPVTMTKKKTVRQPTINL
jgi:hypothetical protein